MTRKQTESKNAKTYSRMYISQHEESGQKTAGSTADRCNSTTGPQRARSKKPVEAPVRIFIWPGETGTQICSRKNSFQHHGIVENRPKCEGIMEMNLTENVENSQKCPTSYTETLPLCYQIVTFAALPFYLRVFHDFRAWGRSQVDDCYRGTQGC